MKKNKKVFDTTNTVIALVLLVSVVSIMGIVVLHQSKKSILMQIQNRMLDMAKTAAGMVDGDELELISSGEMARDESKKVLPILESFQDNMDLAYVYCIGKNFDGSYICTLDPLEGVESAEGMSINKTDALDRAFDGTADADDETTSDSFGTFYSAYCPVFNSNHAVVGVIGVDFDTEWYDTQLSKMRIMIMVIGLISLLLGIVVAEIISWNNRRKFKMLNENVIKLGEGFENLREKMMESSIDKLNLLPENAEKRGVLETLSKGGSRVNVNRIGISDTDYTMRSLNEGIEQFIVYIDSQTYVDQMTRTGNKAAYGKAKKKLFEEIDKGTAKFGIAFFNISHMKKINADYGFETGDRMIFDTAVILREVFGKKSVFHITSDEFIVIADGMGYYDMRSLIVNFDKAIEAYNSKKPKPELKVVRGYDAFQPGLDKDYKDVYQRAAKSSEKYRTNVLEMAESGKTINYY